MSETDDTEKTDTDTANVIEAPAAVKRDLPTWLVQWTISFVASIAVVFIYQFFVHPAGNARIGTVDIAKVYNDARTTLATQFLNDKATPQEREKIKQKYVQFGSNVQEILDQLSRDCGCLIVIRQAVLNNNATDYTIVVKERLGI